jgi:hypothetical protein
VKPRLNVDATYALRASASSTRIQTAQVLPAGDQSEHTAKPESCDVSGHCEARTIAAYIRRANAFKRHLGGEFLSHLKRATTLRIRLLLEETNLEVQDRCFQPPRAYRKWCRAFARDR